MNNPKINSKLKTLRPRRISLWLKNLNLIDKSKLRLNQLLFILFTLTFLSSFSIVSAGGISKDSIITLTNADRVLVGESELVENAKLSEAAHQKTLDMINTGYFSHVSPYGVTPWDFILSNNYDYAIAGENLAIDFATNEGVNNAWLNSTTHAKNILNEEFSDIGVAVETGNINGHETTIVVQMFGKTKQSYLDEIASPLVKVVSSILGIS